MVVLDGRHSPLLFLFLLLDYHRTVNRLNLQVKNFIKSYIFQNVITYSVADPHPNDADA